MHLWSLPLFTFCKLGKIGSFITDFFVVVAITIFYFEICHSRISRGDSSIWVTKWGALSPSQLLRYLTQNRSQRGELPRLKTIHICSDTQLCLTLCDKMDCSSPDSSIHGTFQTRILDWVAMPSSRGIFPTQGSNPHHLCLLHCRWILYC